jgi:mRNA-degrading endonuclease RelE of RelBE toxin-antitoxin system
MPLTQTYNPIIIGFVGGKGYVDIPLQTARDEYGQLPSEYRLVRQAPTRRVRKTPNLSLGLSIIKVLLQGKNLPETIARFYERWGRDFRADFGVEMGPSYHLNDPSVLKRVVEENAEEYRSLQMALLLRPEQGALIPGSGGLRKLRWSAKGRGRRGGCRIIYYWDRAQDTFYVPLA